MRQGMDVRWQELQCAREEVERPCSPDFSPYIQGMNNVAWQLRVWWYSIHISNQENAKSRTVNKHQEIITCLILQPHFDMLMWVGSLQDGSRKWQLHDRSKRNSERAESKTRHSVRGTHIRVHASSPSLSCLLISDEVRKYNVMFCYMINVT